VKNMAASVHDRLLRKAQAEGRPYEELQQLFALERFLYRLACSPYRDRFMLKGALLLTAVSAVPTRATRDIDLLGLINNDPDQVASILQEMCTTPVTDDGLSFDAASITIAPITVEADYNGARATFRGRLGTAVIPMQIDIGIGDAVFPEAEERILPVMLDFPAPALRCYPLETVIAEKLQAIVSLGMVNSRLKDYYDVWLLAQHHDFESSRLGKSIQLTFQRRRTELVADSQALSSEFAAVKARDWRAFLSRSRIEDAPHNLAAVIDDILDFLGPLLHWLLEGAPLTHRWGAGGPWD